MVSSKAKTVKEYLEELPVERRTTIEKVRSVILKNLPKGYEEGMQYGMIGYAVPLKIYPKGYNNDPKVPLCYVGLASQKNYMAVYLMSTYADKKEEEWFVKEYKKTGKKLDMVKSCVRFKKLEDLPLELIGKAVALIPPEKYAQLYEKAREKK